MERDGGGVAINDADKRHGFQPTSCLSAAAPLLIGTTCFKFRESIVRVSDRERFMSELYLPDCRQCAGYNDDRTALATLAIVSKKASDSLAGGMTGE